MKFASFQYLGTARWGRVAEDTIIDLSARFPDLRAAIAANALGQLADAATAAPRIALDAVRWLPVLPNPDKIICIGLNYEEHRQETGRPNVAHPTIFTRFANSQTGHLSAIPLSHLSTELDYEGELAIVIGKTGRYVSAAAAPDYIAGYACYNDISVRDWQRHTQQFAPGKNFPGTGAFGPWLVTPDEVGELATLRIQTRVNGTVVQSARFEQMIFNVARLIEYCSNFTRLEPGDVIVTGTPGGVGAKRTPPLWLKPGDVTEVEIERVGLLRNPIVAETRR